MTNQKLGNRKDVRTARAITLASLLAGTALFGVTVLGTGSASAACSNSGSSGLGDRKVTCDGIDTNGHFRESFGKLDVKVNADAVVSSSTGNALDLISANTLTVDTDAGSSVQGGTSEPGYGILATSGRGGEVTTLGEVSGSLDAINLTFSRNNATYNNSGTITGGGAGVVINRILDDGKTTVTNSGSISAGKNDGILVNRTRGAGDVIVTNTGSIGNSTTRAGDDGIDIQTSGTITITNGAPGTIFAADEGIDATTNNGAISVINLGIIDARDVAVNADGTTGVVIDNSGTIVSLDPGTGDPSGLAVAASSGQAIQLTNSGTIKGRVRLGQSEELTTSSLFDNDGVWDTSGDSAFRGLEGVTLDNAGKLGVTGVTTWTMESTNGNNIFGNTGVFSSSGNTSLSMTTVSGANLVQNQNTIQVQGSLAYQGGDGLMFENYGLLDMRQGSTSDRTTVSGTFSGLAGSRVAIDASLGGTGSESDRLIVGQATAGVTSLLVQDVNSGLGGYNPDGIVFALAPTGHSMLGDFVLDPTSDHYDASRGVLDKGLFFYDIATREGVENPSGVAQVLVGAPDEELFQALHALTAAHHLWHETGRGWVDRKADLRRELMRPQAVLSATSTSPEISETTIAAGSGGIDRGGWTKVFGSWANRSDPQNGLDAGYNQDVQGMLAGLDHATNGVVTPDDTLILGAMAGYVSSQLDFVSSQNAFDMSGATVGAYASYLNNGFFLDVVAKADFVETTWHTPSLAGFGSHSVSGKSTSYGVRAEVGFRFTPIMSVFIEPSATMAYVRTDIDSLTTTGATVHFHSGESVRGGMNLRIGTEIMKSDDYTLEASVAGHIGNEFGGANHVSVANSGPTVLLDYDASGALGEVAGSLDLFSSNSGWSGSLNGGVAFSRDVTTSSVGVGLRKVW